MIFTWFLFRWSVYIYTRLLGVFFILQPILWFFGLVFHSSIYSTYKGMYLYTMIIIIIIFNQIE